VNTLEDDTANSGEYANLNSPYTAAERFSRIERQFHPRKPPLRTITVQEKKERLIKIQKCIDLGMSVEQMSEFLPTWEIPASRTKVYDYLSELKLP